MAEMQMKELTPKEILSKYLAESLPELKPAKLKPLMDSLLALRINKTIKVTDDEAIVLNGLVKAWYAVSPTTTKLNQLTSELAKNIVEKAKKEGKTHESARDVDFADEVPVRIQQIATSFIYKVNMDGAQYLVTLNKPLSELRDVKKGSMTLVSNKDDTNAGKLREILRNEQTAIVSITKDGTTINKNEFGKLYVVAFNNDNITVSSVEDKKRS